MVVDKTSWQCAFASHPSVFACGHAVLDPRVFLSRKSVAGTQRFIHAKNQHLQQKSTKIPSSTHKCVSRDVSGFLHGFSIGFHVAKAITTNKPTIWGWFKCIYMHLYAFMMMLGILMLLLLYIFINALSIKMG